MGLRSDLPWHENDGAFAGEGKGKEVNAPVQAVVVASNGGITMTYRRVCVPDHGFSVDDDVFAGDGDQKVSWDPESLRD
jgi:hypothetical protein